MVTSIVPHSNRLIARLAAEDRLSLDLYLEPVCLALGQVVHESGQEQHWAYFPGTAIISLLNVLQSGASAEIAVVGNEGMLGVALILGDSSMPSRAIVQSAGHAWRISAHNLEQLCLRCAGLRKLLFSYTLSLMAQTAQTAVCNRHHSVDQQLCRWLLLSHDRLAGNELVMTQELIADMLGVRREGVTKAAGNLQRDGLISYQRGRICILNRTGIEERACECYGLVKTESTRLLG